MIPKTIHYCWFGGNPLPELAQKCIASWKKYCPDYEIIEWNESNFDFSECDYAREAYEAKKWAFVSDYARFKILYEYGGVYFDTDVEVIKPIDEIIKNGAYMGCETDGKYSVTKDLTSNRIASKMNTHITVAPGLGIAVNPGLGLYKEILDFYNNIHFKREDGSLNLNTVVKYTTDILVKHGLKDIKGIQKIEGITIYPTEYFCPKNLETGTVAITDNTLTIHHFDGSWLSEEEKYFNYLKLKFNRFLPKKLAHWLSVIVGFTKYRGLLKMPIEVVRYKLRNIKNRSF